MAIKPVAQVAHHLLAHEVHQVSLKYTQRACHDGDACHYAADSPQEVEVGLAALREQSRVENDSNQDGVYCPKPSGHQDQQDNHDPLLPVRLERTGSPLDQALGDFRIIVSSVGCNSHMHIGHQCLESRQLIIWSSVIPSAVCGQRNRRVAEGTSSTT